MLAFVLGALGVIPIGGTMFAPTWQLVVALAPLPAAVDWTTQAMGRRESRAAFRWISGALLGFAFGDLLALLVLRPWWWFAIALGFFAVYVGAILAVLVVSGTWRAVVREHFPGVAAGLPRPLPPPPEGLSPTSREAEPGRAI